MIYKYFVTVEGEGFQHERTKEKLKKEYFGTLRLI
jgi:hypothetical protein